MRDIVRERLWNQYLTGHGSPAALELVGWMGAVQAQEYEHARWGLGLRIANSPAASGVETELAAGRILRTHVLRPTWHFVAAHDLRWMLVLTAPRVHARMAPYHRHLELDPKTLTRATAVIERAVGNGGFLTRAEIGQSLRQARIAVTALRLAHILMHAELECVICSGPRRERQFTYALVSDRVSKGESRSHDEALGELATRYFQSHGPATIRDFVWWSGLTTPEAKRAAGIARTQTRARGALSYHFLESQRAGPSRSGARAHLLPVYDEYLVAYRDREAVPHALATIVTNGRVAGFRHALLVDGQVVGTWRVVAEPGVVEAVPARRLTTPERDALRAATRRYARFAKS